MPTYSLARHEVPPIVSEIIEGYYPDLKEAGVTITCMMAPADLDRDGIKNGPALKHNGYPVAALIKVNSAKDRAEGKADATLTVDGDEWPTWTDRQRLARVHHEIHHLTVVRDDDGEILLDKADRPRLKNRLHDLVLGGFAEIAKLYGEDSGEAAQAEAIPLRHVQLLWDFGEVREGRSRRGSRKAARASGTPQDASTAPLEGQGVLIDDLDEHGAPDGSGGLSGAEGDYRDGMAGMGGQDGSSGEPSEDLDEMERAALEWPEPAEVGA